MSSDPEPERSSESEKPKTTAPSFKKSIASRLTGTPLDLPDDLREKVRETASSLGKTEAEVYQDLVTELPRAEGVH